MLSNPSGVVGACFFHAIYKNVFGTYDVSVLDYAALGKLTVEQRLKLSPEEKQKYMVIEKRPIESHSIYVYAMFPQVWGDSSCGFGGMAAQAITNAYTVVVCTDFDSTLFAVYFGGKFAYLVKNPTQEFFDDLQNRRLASLPMMVGSKTYSRDTRIGQVEPSLDA